MLCVKKKKKMLITKSICVVCEGERAGEIE